MPKTPTDLHDAETDIRPSSLEQGDATELFGEGEPDDLQHVFGNDGVYADVAKANDEPSSD